MSKSSPSGLSTISDYYAVAFFAALLIVTDAVLTIVFVRSGLAVEANPLLNLLTGGGTDRLELVLAFKVWLSIIGLTFLGTIASDEITVTEHKDGGVIAYYPQRLVRLARVGLWVILGVYLLVNVYHVLGIILWL